MRKYAITRKSAVTTAQVKAVNTNTFEVVDMVATLEGAFSDTTTALKAVTKIWENDEFKPIAVTALSCTIKTLGMTASQWFDHADVLAEEEVTPEQAATFGKRSKKPGEQ